MALGQEDEQQHRYVGVRGRRSLLRVIGGILTFGLAFGACGGDSPMSPPPPAAPTTINEAFTNFQESAGAGLIALEFNVPVAASVAIQMDWTPVEADLDMRLTPGLCVSGTCDQSNIIAAAISFSNPENLALSVVPGDYTVLLENLGPGVAAGTVMVTITPS